MVWDPKDPWGKKQDPLEEALKQAQEQLQQAQRDFETARQREQAAHPDAAKKAAEMAAESDAVEKELAKHGLTVDFAHERGAAVILRGLRALSDFEFELQIAHTNTSLAPNVETLFLATAVQHSFLSSSVVKEVARFGGAVDHMVPTGVAEDLARLFNQASPTAP